MVGMTDTTYTIEPMRFEGPNHGPGFTLETDDCCVQVWLPREDRDHCAVHYARGWDGDAEDGDWQTSTYEKFPTVDKAVSFLLRCGPEGAAMANQVQS